MTHTSLTGKRVWVAGGSGMVGRALLQRLEKENCTVLAPRRVELDLRNQREVEKWVATHQPEIVFLLAARVGGIQANNMFSAEFIYDNIVIQTNIIHSSWLNNVEKLLFLGSSCTYPKEAPQPIKENELLNGLLEPTNQWYAVAKLAGIKMCQAYRKQYGCNFIVAMPTNTYGEGDNFNPSQSHVIPAFIRRLHEAYKNESPLVEIWGSGTPLREFIYVRDLADACVFLMKKYESPEIINIGSQEEITIRALTEEISSIVGYKGKFCFDQTKPDGVARKLLDSSKILSLGWQPHTFLKEGLRCTYDWYCKNY